MMAGAMERFVVVVKWGVRPNMPFATVPSLKSAEVLAIRAARLGYRNPRIVTDSEFQKIRNKRLASNQESA